MTKASVEHINPKGLIVNPAFTQAACSPMPAVTAAITNRRIEETTVRGLVTFVQSCGQT